MNRDRWRLAAAALLLTGSILGTLVWAETVEIPTYLPAAINNLNRFHAKRMSVGPAYAQATVPNSALLDGNLIISTRLGVGTFTPAYTVDVFASNGARFFGTTGFENAVYLVPSSIDSGLSGLAIGYNQTYNGTPMTNAGFLQAETSGTGYRNLLLNPMGGFVGVHTTSALVPLQIIDDTAGGQRPSLVIQRTSGGGIPGPRIGLMDTNGATPITSPVWAIENLSNAFRLTRQATINGAVTELLRITSAGQVGLGTSSPSARMQIYTPSGRTIRLESASNAETLWAASNNGIGVLAYTQDPGSIGIRSEGATGILGFSGDAYGVGVWANGAYIGLLVEAEDDGVQAYASGTNGIGTYARSENYIGIRASGFDYDFYPNGPGENYGSSSSIRWKTDIHPIEGALEKILQLRGVSFRWDEPHGGHQDIGFIGEEVGPVVPEIVVYEENGVDADGMDYSRLTPILLEAIREQKKRVDQLKSEIAELEKTLAR
ncbi:MAG: tail fiber domain-containing protein [Candidatus Omnitrophica bacterium]|nr:tail fiber domain-containing protein [Candidatus Omnitrophota bacterium]